MLTDIRILDPTTVLPASALDAYLTAQRERFIREYGETDGVAQLDRLRLELDQHLTRLESFLTPRAPEGTSELIIGRVQSGKTAHFLATLAWAADSGFAGAVVVSGRTKDLSRQTLDRIKRDLERLGRWPMVRIYEAPTERRPDKGLVRDFAQDVARRLGEQGERAPMPIVVTLKTPSRIRVATKLLSSITTSSPETHLPLYLIIDDETDQASQNSSARAGKESKVYESLRRLRQAAKTHIFLGYTATPQAVLLSAPTNAVGPQYVHVVEPGRGYFGLGDLLWDGQSDAARVDRTAHARVHEVSDLRQFAGGRRIADSLQKALLRFLIVGGVRRCRPDLFFSRAPIGVDLDARSPHVAFLVHPSRETDPHERATDVIEEFLADPIFTNPALTAQLKHDLLLPAYASWRNQLPPGLRAEAPDPEKDPNDVDEILEDVVQGLRFHRQTRLVNSAASVSGIQRGFPQDDDWGTAAYWILVGGDILGRGMTVPNLVGTYFLRNPDSPAQDTVVQQMRFCGYRQDYADHIDVWAPARVIRHYMDIDAIEEVMLRYYRRYDADQTLISSGIRIAYIAPKGATLRPTRPDVISRTIQDTSSNGTLLATLAIGGPQLTVENAKRVARWLRDLAPAGWAALDNEWRVTQSDPSEVQQLLTGFACESRDERGKQLVRALLNPDLGHWSLGQYTFRLFVQQAELLLSDVTSWDPTSTTTGPLRSRGRARVSPPLAPTAAAWRAQVQRHVEGGALVPTATFEDIRIGTLIGREIRDLRKKDEDDVGSDSVCVFLQPIGIGEEGTDDGSPVTRRRAVGIALMVLAPPGLKVRILGHP